MHVLLVSLHTSPWTALGTGDGGGMNVTVAEQARALAARGHRVVVATRRDSATAPERVEAGPGVELVHLPAGPAAPLPKSRIDDHLDEFAAHLARLQRPDVVHAHHWMSGVAALPAARTWGVGLATSFHSIAAPEGAGLDAGEPPESPRRIPGERACAEQSDLLVTISDAEARTLQERYAADPARCVTVRPGVDHGLFRPAAEPAGRAAPLLFAARLQPLKGLDLVIDALALLPTAARPRLIVAGEVSADFADHHREIEDAVAGAGLVDHVAYAGALPRADFVRLVQGARAMLVPSRSETFGLVALEAAACGVPVLASDSGGLREAVADGRSGLLLPREPAVWADEIARLADDAWHTRLARGAIGFAAGFTWAASAERLEGAYARIARPDPEG